MGKIIAVMGSKGGVGQTLVAINLAVALKSQTKKRVALLDFNFAMAGEIALLLAVPQTKSLLDLLSVIDKLSPQMLKGYVVEHSSGIDFLSAVGESTDAQKILPAHSEKTVSFFSTVYDYVIVNIGRSFNDLQLAVMDNVDMVVLVATPELASLYHTKKVWQQFIINHYPTQMLKVVLNKADIAGGLSVDQVSEYIKQRPTWLIPNDADSAVLSINRGVPAVIASTRSPFSRGIYSIVNTIVEESARAEKGAGLFAGLKHSMESVRKEHRISRSEKEVVEVKSSSGNLLPPTDELKMRVYNKLVAEMKERRIELSPSFDKQKLAETRQTVQEAIERILNSEGEKLTARVDRVRLVMEVLDQSLGLGPLEDFLRDPTITE
ncbi:MAG: P-loop NTPase, partial [Patescibacteria group bacterium]